MKTLNNESGAVLILVLSALLILAIATAALVASTRTSILLTNRVEQDVHASFDLKTGVDLAIGLVQQRTSDEKPLLCQRFEYITASGTPVLTTVASDDSLLTQGKTSVLIVDEQSKIDLNFATKEELLRIPGITNQIAGSILEWREFSNQSRSIAARSNYYDRLAVPYKCKSAPFESIEELLLVRGISGEIFDQMSEFVTTHSDGSVNLNTCSREVLAILGFEESLSRRIVALRDGPDGLTGTGDDLVFNSPENISDQLQHRFVLEDHEVNQLMHLLSKKRLGVRSVYYRIVVSTRTQSASLRRTATAIVEFRDRKSTRFCFWNTL